VGKAHIVQACGDAGIRKRQGLYFADMWRISISRSVSVHARVLLLDVGVYVQAIDVLRRERLKAPGKGVLVLEDMSVDSGQFGEMVAGGRVDCGVWLKLVLIVDGPVVS
jgi:hypothetical protein